MDSKKINRKSKICVIGAGYVGLVSGTCLAEIGHKVVCVDNNKEKIKKLQNGICPIFEPGLDKMIAKNKKEGRLFFTEDIEYAVKSADIIFIAVHTPTKENGETDLQFVEDVSKQVAKAMDSYKIIVSKSTMPVKTGQKIKEIISKFCKKGVDFDVVSNPEFLREGSAIKDFLEPDRIVIGVESKKAMQIMKTIYLPIKAPIIFTCIESAEIIKHSCNAFLATKISFINAIANICEKNHGDVEEVANAIGLDKRIGQSFLSAGIGFGGSCFPKDVSAFINVAQKSGYDFSLLREVEKINQRQKENFVKKIKESISGLENGLKNKKLGILGLSFKPNTDDMRFAPSVYIINRLLAEGATIKAFDPVAKENAKKIFKDKIVYCSDVFETAKNCDALIILTEWDEFKKINLKKIKSLLKNPIIIDGRNIFNPEKIKKLGFNYISIGRK
jgi:UDPglucose 6-dehydrogenase